MAKSAYQLTIQSDGSGSAKTVYGDKIPTGKVALIESLAAYVYTTAIGDYTTAKFIFIGFDHEGTIFYVEGEDINATNTMRAMVSAKTPIVLNEGDRLLATFEATATSTTYKLVATGWLIDKADLAK